MLKILHLAPQNYAGVPYDFFKMHNSAGDYARLVTYHKNPIDFPEDICLDLPLPNTGFAKKWRKRKVLDKEGTSIESASYFEAKNFPERIYFKFNDKRRRRSVERAIEKYNLDDFDIIHYDGGLDFYRYPNQALKWKKEGKKIICCYYGSDLRIRGLIRELDEISDLNITSEYDHLALKENLHYLFYPYDPSELPSRSNTENEIPVITHSPTNRKFKGTEIILNVIERIKKEKNIRFVLLENKPRNEVLEEKCKSDISIDQVGGAMGGTGYGKAGLETLAMGIPTITNMTEEYNAWLPENPFVVANNKDELYNKINELLESKDYREQVGENGKQWVEKYHGYESVDSKLKELYRLNKII